MRTPEQLRQRAEKAIDKRLGRSQRVQVAMAGVSTASGAAAEHTLYAGYPMIVAETAAAVGVVAGIFSTVERAYTRRKLAKILNRYEKAVGVKPGAGDTFDSRIGSTEPYDYILPLMANLGYFAGGLLLKHGMDNPMNNVPIAQKAEMAMGGAFLAAGMIFNAGDWDNYRKRGKKYKEQIANIDASVKLKPPGGETEFIPEDVMPFETRAEQLVGRANNGIFRVDVVDPETDTTKQYEIAVETEDKSFKFKMTKRSLRRYSYINRKTRVEIKELSQGDDSTLQQNPFEEMVIDTHLYPRYSNIAGSRIRATVGYYDAERQRVVTHEDKATDQDPRRAFETREERRERMERIIELLDKVTPENRINEPILSHPEVVTV